MTPRRWPLGQPAAALLTCAAAGLVGTRMIGLGSIAIGGESVVAVHVARGPSGEHETWVT